MNSEQLLQKPDIKLSVKQTFGFDSDMKVGAFSKKNEYVPKIDPDYKFDKDTTLAILAGFSFNKRVLIQGYHGTGKSTHIEQVAARLNWPCIRVNLDSHISRIDLIGKDAIILKDGKQVTEFKEGILPWSIQNPVALVFDEYDAGRPDVMFVIQRVLESNGNFTLLDKNKVLEQHDFFRIFATTNTVGLGDTSGLYHGTQQINQGQMDRWNIVSTLNYLSNEQEINIILSKVKKLNNKLKIERDKKYFKAASKRIKKTKVIEDEYLDTIENNKSKPRVPFGSLVELGILKPGTTLFDPKKRLMQKLWLMEVLNIKSQKVQFIKWQQQLWEQKALMVGLIGIVILMDLLL